jgi:hypothetical protein
MGQSHNPQQLRTMDKRIQERLLRQQGKSFTEQVRSASGSLPDLGERAPTRTPEEVEAFTRDLGNEKKLREQRIARQLRGEVRTPQAELLPGDTRD